MTNVEGEFQWVSMLLCAVSILSDCCIVSTTFSYESHLEAEFQWVSTLSCVVIRQK